jgi:hypothetical protein
MEVREDVCLYVQVARLRTQFLCSASSSFVLLTFCPQQQQNLANFTSRNDITPTMIVIRTLSLALRAFQFLCATIVLALTAHFLHLYKASSSSPTANSPPFDRLIFSVIIAAISLTLSLIWMVPNTSSLIHWVVDLLLAAAWFAMFGILQDWYDNVLLCGGGWRWRFFNGGCGQWSAVQAFAFLSAVAWGVSAVLGLVVWARRNKAGVEGRAVPAGATTTTTKG